MSLPRFATLIAAIGLSVVVDIPTQASPPPTERTGQASSTQDSRPANCRVTLPSNGRFTPPGPFPADPDSSGASYFWFGSEKLWTSLPVDGAWRGLGPYSPDDSTYRQKIPWYRIHPGFSPRGHGTITARRLDGPAPSLKLAFSTSVLTTDKISMAMSAVDLPTLGCWEITGSYGSDEVTFVIWVTEPRIPAPVPPDRVQVDSTVEARKLVSKTDPEIPALAERAGITSGVVAFRAIIAKDGSVRELSYRSGPPLLMKAAMDAAKNWRYKPTELNEEAVEVETTIDVSFAPLQDK